MKAEDVLNNMIEEMPFNLTEKVKPYIIEAMKVYANHKIKDCDKRIEKAYYCGYFDGDRGIKPTESL